jgi:imidazolonepropionase-like amidohydrolase
MTMKIQSLIILLLGTGLLLSYRVIENEATNDSFLLTNLRLIDGNGGKVIERTDLFIQGGRIAAIGPDQIKKGASVIDMRGRTVIPSLISTHVHIGTLKGISVKAENYTRENILSQLKKYEDYGVGNLLVMGSDRPMMFEDGIRDSSIRGLLPGAIIHSAGYGFGAPLGVPPVGFGFDRIYRPSGPKQVAAEMDSLVKIKPDLVKLWLDDFGGQFKKMDPAIYKEIIIQAHKHGLRVAAHVYYLSDARQLLKEGVDIFAHSIRDSLVSADLIREMKSRHTMYIPTLSLDEFAYIYARKPDWINDAFFKNSLEPGVYEMISSEKYQNDLKNAPAYARNVRAYETALKNLKRLFDAGILVCLGTDSGAQPVRAQGFSEHLELELMVQAGLTPVQAITVGTRNASRLLKIDKDFGTIEIGKRADFLILDGDPSIDIKNTRKIVAVYKAGKKVSAGPATGQ